MSDSLVSANAMAIDGLAPLTAMTSDIIRSQKRYSCEINSLGTSYA